MRGNAIHEAKSLTLINPELRDLLGGKAVYRQTDLGGSDADEPNNGDGPSSAPTKRKASKSRKKPRKDGQQKEGATCASGSQKPSTRKEPPHDEAASGCPKVRPVPPVPDCQEHANQKAPSEASGQASQSVAFPSDAAVGSDQVSGAVPDCSQTDASMRSYGSSEQEPPTTCESDASMLGRLSSEGCDVLALLRANHFFSG